MKNGGHVNCLRLEIQNDAAQQAIHVLAIGRKNRSFASSEGNDETAAIAYTKIDTAMLNTTDPQA